MTLYFIILILFSGYPLNVYCIKIDNELLEDYYPDIECNDDMMYMTFATRKPFTGRVYFKGLPTDHRCSFHFVENQPVIEHEVGFNKPMLENLVYIAVKTGECGMTKHRVKGDEVTYSFVVIVSFHLTFVTKVDRAYNFICPSKIIEHFGGIKRLTQVVDFSTIGTTFVDNSVVPHTSCVYTIRDNSTKEYEYYETVRYAKVGDKLVHKWQCDNEDLGFLVHSCSSHNGRGQKFYFYDIDGCAIDPLIMPDITYNADLTIASVETHGFKFSDTTTMKFDCVLEFCDKKSSYCDGLTPPDCNLRRSRRRIDNETTDSIDLSASIDVLDRYENEIDERPLPIELLNGKHQMIAGRPLGKDLNVVHSEQDNTCMTLETGCFMLGFLVISAISAATFSFLLLLRIRMRNLIDL